MSEKRKQNEEDSFPGKICRCNATLGQSIYSTELNDSMKEDFNAFFDKKLEEMKDFIIEQNKGTIEALEANAALMQKLLTQEQKMNEQNMIFPLKSSEDLEKLERELNDENFSFYVQLVKKIIYPCGFGRNLDKLMEEGLIHQYNYGGSHGKLPFNKYSNINKLFTRVYDGPDYVKIITTAFHVIKSRINKRAFVERQKSRDN